MRTGTETMRVYPAWQAAPTIDVQNWKQTGVNLEITFLKYTAGKMSGSKQSDEIY